MNMNMVIIMNSPGQECPRHTSTNILIRMSILIHMSMNTRMSMGIRMGGA